MNTKYSAVKSKAELLQSVSAQAKLAGKEIFIFCKSFAYAGLATEIVAGDFVVLEGAKWIFETGEFTNKEWNYAEAVPSGEWFVNVNEVESFGILK